jgi:hypothetical protein
MPLFNFFRFFETGNFDYYLLNNSVSVSFSEKKEAYFYVMDSFRKCFGNSDETEYVLELKKELFDLACEFLKTKNRTLITDIELKELELSTFEVKKVGKIDSSFSAFVEKYGYVPQKQISVFEYFSLLKG